ncbi:MAG: ankyrin repeat domain-containing protein [Nitrosomonadaceae bacterium]|nr:MAG: ankyrin repeat domain-containing protein [Nitrosomonadaceae bacterium]
MQRRIEVTVLRKHLRILAMLLALCCIPASTWAHSGGDHPLINAAGRGDLSQVKMLLAAKADVNDDAGRGITALMVASQNGHREIVQALLAAKANVNIKTRNGDTPLIAATQNGHEAVVQLLKKAGAR